ncbi:tagatose-6-phosphate ketose/aldose isomerase [Pilibacter termitis]|uniref:Tagatose-6-phosphate ketose/aldose isomerase n=1 Tax=Pilibacter termitis TaxID=263852 RepID=A0A1T4KU66_9ENTE|nr:SIS domain-containing protein [Pilibacter termitis]SJZ45984.1 tagatose-6-phosphate ketose/aldose isomerase [Pilibacter termitis]
MLKFTDEELKDLGAIITAREIYQQPTLWQQTLEDYVGKKGEIDKFLTDFLEKHTFGRIIFTGAGTSQYVGDVVQRSLQKSGDTKHFRFESIATTDIVATPETTLEKDTPTILISFARSGNSPESLAAVELVDQVVRDSYHIVMTCAKEGKLAKQTENRPNALVLLLPEKSNDQGFAMTGSCSSMMLLATLVFSTFSEEKKAEQVGKIIQIAQDVLDREAEVVAHLPKDTQRVIYVGSGPAAALTREAQLKILELTAGKIATLYDSSMGLRHGPKSFIDEKTAVYVYCANDNYTRQYDLDLYNEVKEDEIANVVTLIGQGLEVDGFELGSEKTLEEEFIVFPFLVFAQIISITASVMIGNTPDTPSATGTVNRVVKGVIIHEYEER